MLDSGTLAKWYELAANDPIVKDLADIHREANENLWTFSPEEAEIHELNSENVTSFIRAIVEARTLGRTSWDS